MSEEQDKLNRAMAMIGPGRISRRDFVQLAIATGLTATAASTLYAQTARAEPKSGMNKVSPTNTASPIR